MVLYPLALSAAWIGTAESSLVLAAAVVAKLMISLVVDPFGVKRLQSGRLRAFPPLHLAVLVVSNKAARFGTMLVKVVLAV